MATNKEINEFAVRWLKKFSDRNTSEYDINEDFSEECISLGFEICEEEIFEEVFLGMNAFKDSDTLNEIIDQIEDIFLLGSAIYTKWRNITNGEKASILESQHQNWFVTALSRLDILTAGLDCSFGTFQGKIEKFRLVTNIICFGPSPEPDCEVEHKLIITANGEVWFSSYNYGQGSNYSPRRTEHFSIGEEAVTGIFKALEVHFGDGYSPNFITDIGTWRMTVTNSEGRVYNFEGSLYCDLGANDNDLSDLIRTSLKMPDLFVFDGNRCPDRVDRVTVNYSASKKKRHKESNNDGELILNYEEQLVIDRKSDTIEYIQEYGTGCILSRKYYVQGAIEILLDELDTECLFKDIASYVPDVISKKFIANNYEIKVTFKKQPELIINGTFVENGLPVDFPKFAKRIEDFIEYYDGGQVLTPFIYGRTRSEVGDHIFCSVQFSSGGKSYYYVTKDDTLTIGDLVLVPVGKSDNIITAEIVDIEYFSEGETPFPLAGLKEIIGRSTGVDFNQSDNRFFYQESASSFPEFILCQEETPRVKVYVSASLPGGCLVISGHDLGQAVEDVYGKNELEYFYDFDRENTRRLIELLTSGGQDFKEMLVQEFGGIDGCLALRGFCDANGIVYKFFLW